MPGTQSRVRPPSVVLWPPLFTALFTALVFCAFELLASIWSNSEASPSWAASQLDISHGVAFDRHSVDAELHSLLIFALIMLISAFSLTLCNAVWRIERKRASAFGFGSRSSQRSTETLAHSETGQVLSQPSGGGETPTCDRLKSTALCYICALKGVGLWLVSPLQLYGAAWPLAELGGWVCGAASAVAAAVGLFGGRFPSAFAGALAVTNTDEGGCSRKIVAMTYSPSSFILLVFSGFALWALRRVVRKRHLSAAQAGKRMMGSSEDTGTDTEEEGVPPGSSNQAQEKMGRLAAHWSAFLVLNVCMAVVAGTLAGERLRPISAGSGVSNGATAAPWHLVLIAVLLSALALGWLAYTLLQPAQDPLFTRILRALALPFLLLSALQYSAMAGWAHNPWISLPITRQVGYLVVLVAPLVATAFALSSAVGDVAVKEKAFQTLAHEVRGPVQNIRTALSSMHSGLQGRLVASSDLSAALVLLFTQGNAKFLTDLLARDTVNALPMTSPTISASVSGTGGGKGRLGAPSPTAMSGYGPIASSERRQRPSGRMLSGASNQDSADARSDSPSVDWHLLSTGGAFSSSVAPSPVAIHQHSADGNTGGLEVGRGVGTAVPITAAYASAPGASASQGMGAASEPSSGGPDSSGGGVKGGAPPHGGRRISATSDVSELHSVLVLPEGGAPQGTAEHALAPEEEHTRDTIDSIIASPPVLGGAAVGAAGDGGSSKQDAGYVEQHGASAAVPGRNRLGAFGGAGSRSMIEGGALLLQPLQAGDTKQQRPNGPLLRAMSGGGNNPHAQPGVLAPGKAPLHAPMGGGHPPHGMRKAVTLDSFAHGAKQPPLQAGQPPVPDRTRASSTGKRSRRRLVGATRTGSVGTGSVLSGAEEYRLLASAQAMSAAADAITAAAAGLGPQRGASGDRRRVARDTTDDSAALQQHDSGAYSFSARSSTSDTSVLTSARVQRALSQVVRLNRWAGSSAFKSMARDGTGRRALRSTGTSKTVVSGSVMSSAHTRGGGGGGGGGGGLVVRTDLGSGPIPPRTARSTLSGRTPSAKRGAGSLAHAAIRSANTRVHLLRPSMELLRSFQEADVSSRMLLDNLDAQLELARLRSGKQDISTEAFSLGELLQNLRTSMRQRFAENGVVAEWAPCTPLGMTECLWRTSRKRLQQAALNILTNAAKYGRPEGADKGRVEIKAELSELTLPPEAVRALQTHAARRRQQRASDAAGARQRAPSLLDAARGTGSSAGFASGMLSRFFSTAVPEVTVARSGSAAPSAGAAGGGGDIHMAPSSTSTEPGGAVASPFLASLAAPASAAEGGTREIANAAFAELRCAQVLDMDGGLRKALGAAVTAALKGSGGARRPTWLQRSSGKPPPRPDATSGGATQLHTPDLLDDSTGHTPNPVSLGTGGGTGVGTGGIAGGSGDAMPSLSSDAPELQQMCVPEGTRMVFRFSVRDFGMGMTQAEQEGVFQDFTRLHQDNKGTGLGLGVAREAMRLLQGDVWCNSKGKGHGSTFTVEVPVVLEGAASDGDTSASDNSDSDSDTVSTKTPTHAAGGTGLPLTVPMPLQGGAGSGIGSAAGSGGGTSIATGSELDVPQTQGSSRSLSHDSRQDSNTSAVVQSHGNGIAVATSDEEEGALGQGGGEPVVMDSPPPDPLPAELARGAQGRDDLLSTIDEQSLDGRTVGTGSFVGGGIDSAGATGNNVSTPSSGSAGGSHPRHISHRSGNPLPSPGTSLGTGQMQLQPLTGTGIPSVQATPLRAKGFGYSGSMGTTGSVMRHSTSVTGYGGGADAPPPLVQRQSSSASASMGVGGGVMGGAAGMARQSSSASLAPAHGGKPTAPHTRSGSLLRGGYGSMGSRAGSLDIPDDAASASLRPSMSPPVVSGDQRGTGARSSTGDIERRHGGAGGRTGHTAAKSEELVPGAAAAGGGLMRFPSTAEYMPVGDSTTAEFLPGQGSHEDALDSSMRSAPHHVRGASGASGVSLGSDGTDATASVHDAPLHLRGGIRSASPPGGGGRKHSSAELSLSTTDGERAERSSLSSPAVPPQGTGEAKGTPAGAGGGAPRPRLLSETASTASHGDKHPRHVRVLVVDDDQTLLRQARRQIRKAPAFHKGGKGGKYDVSVTTAQDGDEAVELILRGAGGGSEAVTHITLDGNMQRMGGVQATALLREGGFGGVIVGITGGDEEREQFLDAGADDALVKPVEWDQVAVVLKKCARRRASRR